MFSCLQILEAFLWFVLITLLNVTLIILTLSVSRLLNLLLRLVAFLLFLNPQCLASISRWITASSSWKRFCLFVCRALSSIMVICMLTARSEERFSRNAETDLVCRLLLEKKNGQCQLHRRCRRHGAEHDGLGRPRRNDPRFRRLPVTIQSRRRPRGDQRRHPRRRLRDRARHLRVDAASQDRHRGRHRRHRQIPDRVGTASGRL